MYDSQQSCLITAAVSRLQHELAQAAPLLAQHVSRWMQQLAGGTDPAAYFTHPQAFPSLLLPWWLEKSLGFGHDLAFQGDLAYSTINGYYAIRLADNLMDGNSTVELKLLPILNFFQTQFQAAYHPYFAADHPFWRFFKTTWYHSAEVTFQDALLTDLEAAQFEQVAAQKICAAKIPLAAVGYRSDRADLIAAWSRCVDLFGCWHQLLNDLFGWQRDYSSGIHTYFLAEAERRRFPDELVLSWVAREGFAWAIETAQGWMSALQALAQELHSPDLLVYLELRESMLQKQAHEVAAGLEALARIAVVSRQQGAG
ncbi:MAG: hypothetical protein KJ077_10125 [Anaerolineae bacterium]|nr:hypothetical protein [Anaerolineae bacterium]